METYTTIRSGDRVAFVHRRYRLGLRVVLWLPVAALFAWPIWREVRVLHDYHSSYSGVVIEKGEDRDYTGRYFHVDLYIVIQDDAGKKSKKFTGSQRSRSDRRVWDSLEIGGYVVKDAGFGHYPRETRGPARNGHNSN